MFFSSLSLSLPFGGACLPQAGFREALLKSFRAISITRLAHHCLPPVTYQRRSLRRPL